MDRLEDKNPGNSIVDCVIPFLTAAQGGHLKICEFFINQLTDKNPGQNGWTPFHEAARSGKLDVCKLFMEKLEETNPISNNGLTVLHAAAHGGHANVYEFLMEKFDDKNPQTNGGWTPLHIAAQHGHLEVCALILKNIQTIKGLMVQCNGKTPLALASENERFMCMLGINSRLQSLLLYHTRKARPGLFENL